MEPRRIVSLVPSDSYTLVQLGVGDRLVGRTTYCVEPASLSEIEAVGGTKNADVERIVALKPDLVVVNQEENRRVDIERLEQAGLQILLSFPKTVLEGLEHCERLAALFPSVDNGAVLAGARTSWERFASRTVVPVPTFVPIWMDPLMTVHGDTFISDALELCGGRNVFSDRQRRYPLSADLGQREPLPPSQIEGRDTRYPRVTLEELKARAPRLVLLPNEPHEFTEKDADVFRDAGLDASVRFCDGKDLMWYGLRTLEGLERLAATVATC
jgi:ABC-type Fe3+-hydroxamate transport system substrate-binding protein